MSWADYAVRMKRKRMANTRKTTKRTGTKKTTRKTAGRTARSGTPAVNDMNLSSRTRASALGKWMAKREAVKAGFGDEVLSAYNTAIAKRTARPMRVAQVEPRENGAAGATH